MSTGTSWRLKPTPLEPITIVMELAATLRRRLACERGFTLIEALVASLVMVILLIAIAKVGDAGQATATRDGELALAVSESQPGLDRMVRELRQAVAVNATASATGRCAARANCVDFNVMGRTPTDASGKPIAGASRSLYRIRYECAATGGATVASCRRYLSPDVTVPATAQGSPVVERVLNWNPASSTPIFRYRTKTGAELAATDPLTAAKTVDVAIQVPAKGTRKTGLAYNIVLQDGAHLKNLDLETTP
jgi:Tfp pilus assembly protein PilV